jgi:hypothetical protein
VTLLAQVSAVLDAHGVVHAVIGAAALAVHGVTRASADLDVLATDARCLDPGWWTPLGASGATVDIRRGDPSDPLAGVVRLALADEAPVDVIVGRARWQEDILRRAARITLPEVAVRVAGAADLVLLKLYAGGPQDAWDVDQLLDAVPGIEPEVEARLAQLPADCTALWQRIVGGRSRP